ncbi:RDD family protein [Mucilaginibacter paludis]|uniref:RDD domain containing protein n=1 Tax=Mucilaginibacter paludis DSM 18603 TaxID=714943 RepID=H1YF34_9SPHI|nr:RDD family protein [Mucilaginibacter paludis]EHQ25287.1 RDD domain containing protein [Mucilaginibacter paludis DSM 18603]
MNNEYYILKDGQRVGPFNTQELMDKPLESDDVILLPSQTQGIPAYTMPEFKSYFKSEGIYYPTRENTSTYFLRLPAYIIDAFVVAIGTEILALFIFPQYMFKLQGVFTLELMKDPNALAQTLKKYSTDVIIIHTVLSLMIILYNAICESSKIRASIGKYVLGLAVVDESGYSLSFGQAFKRNIGKIIYLIMDFLIGALSYIAYMRIIWGDRHQAIHDRFAACFVVSKKM